MFDDWFGPTGFMPHDVYMVFDVHWKVGCGDSSAVGLGLGEYKYLLRRELFRLGKSTRLLQFVNDHFWWWEEVYPIYLIEVIQLGPEHSLIRRSRDIIIREFLLQGTGVFGEVTGDALELAEVLGQGLSFFGREFLLMNRHEVPRVECLKKTFIIICAHAFNNLFEW